MAEEATELDKSGTISRQALGRIAKLGDLYDATTDRFCAMSIFKETLEPDSKAITATDNRHSKISFTTVSGLHEKLKELDVTGTLKLSVLAGMVDLDGSAKYLNSKKNSFKSVESALLYNIKTVVERLNLHGLCATSTFRDTSEPNSNSPVTNDEKETLLISQDAMRRSGATHVVVEIYWGATCTVTVTDQNSEDEEKGDVEGSLKLEMGKIKLLIAGGDEDISGKAVERKSDDANRFSLEIFGDVLIDSSDVFPNTLERAVETIKRVPELTSTSNDGKGIPLTYIMIPLSSLPFQNRQLKLPVFSNVDEGKIVRIIHLFDYMSEVQQKAQDLVDELNNHGYHCVTTKELFDARSCEQRPEVQLGRAKGHLAELLKEIRSDNSESESRVEEFCKSNYEVAEKTLKECENIYKYQQMQIEFAKRCKKAGAKYLAPPVEQRIERACDEYGNVYVLFDGEFNPETDGETGRKTLLRKKPLGVH